MQTPLTKFDSFTMNALIGYFDAYIAQVIEKRKSTRDFYAFIVFVSWVSWNWMLLFSIYRVTLSTTEAGYVTLNKTDREGLGLEVVCIRIR